MTPRPFTARESLAALAASLALAALLLADALFGSSCMLGFPVSDPRVDIRPWARAGPGAAALPDVNLATPDVTGYVLPGLVRTRQLLAAGGSGAWDDGQLLGFPFAANGYFPQPSPAEWLTRPFDPLTALDLLLAAHLAAALWLGYRAARLLGAAPPFAAVAALGFALSGWMISRWHCPPMAWATAWFPLQLSALARLRQGRAALAAFEFGAGTALALVSGFPQSVLLLTGAAGLFMLSDPALRRPRPLATLALAGLAGVAVALPVLLPALRASRASLRAQPEAVHALALSRVPPAALVDLLLPELFGDPVAFGRPDPPAPTMADWLPQRVFFEPRLQSNVAEVAGYVGLLLLLLLPGALAARGDPRRLAVIALLGLAGSVLAPHLLTLSPATEKLALGNSKRLLAVWCSTLPFAGALAAQAVVERRARLPHAWGGLLLAALLAAPPLAAALRDGQAAAFAADLWLQAGRQAPLLLAALAALALARRGAARAAARGAVSGASAWLPALALGLDLAGYSRAFNPPVPDEALLPPTATVSALTPLASSSTQPAGRPPVGRVAVFGAGQNLLPPSLAAAAGLRSMGGFTALAPTETAELLGCIEGPLFEAADPRIARPLRDVASLRHPLLDLIGVTAIVHADPTLPAASGLPVLFEAPDEGLAGLSRPGADPPAFLCGGAAVLPAREQRLAWLARPDAPVFDTVLLEREPPFPLPERRAAGRLDGKVVLERAQPEAFTVRCEASEPAVLVVSEAWDPGWRLQLDGAEAMVERVDHALIGAFVPAGPHELRFEYATPGAGAARALAVVGVAVLVAAACLALRPAPRDVV